MIYFWFYVLRFLLIQSSIEPPNKFEDQELETLFDKDYFQIQEEHADTLGLTQAAIS